MDRTKRKEEQCSFRKVVTVEQVEMTSSTSDINEKCKSKLRRGGTKRSCPEVKI